MTSLPNVLNVHNVLNDSTACAIGSATSNGPNVLNLSFALKYAPGLAVMTLSGWCYRFAINRLHFLTYTWKDKPDGEIAQTSMIFLNPVMVYGLFCLHEVTTNTCYSLRESQLMGCVFDYLSQRTKRRSEVTTQSSYTQTCCETIHFIFTTTWISFLAEICFLLGFFKQK